MKTLKDIVVAFTNEHNRKKRDLLIDKSAKLIMANGYSREQVCNLLTFICFNSDIGMSVDDSYDALHEIGVVVHEF